MSSSSSWTSVPLNKDDPIIIPPDATTTAAFHTQVAVIGAGVLGLAVARQLTAALDHGNKEVLLLERNTHMAQETSSRNSEVIHAGIYYPKDSLKAQLCVRGKDLLYGYLEERGNNSIPYRQCGKLIVATQESQWKHELPRLQQQASRNGVTDLRLLSKEDVQYLEPDVECHGALYSPSSGILDSHTYFLSLLGEAEDHGAVLAVDTTVVNAFYQDQRLWLQTTQSTTKSSAAANESETTWISCDVVVNAAGLWADQIAQMMHHHQHVSNNTGNTQQQQEIWQPPRHYFAKGTYFALQGGSSSNKPSFSHLIYPVPEAGGLGIHATLDLAGNIKFGPDVEWVDADVTVHDLDYTPDSARGDKFYNAIRQYWPDLSDGSLQADYVGVRPKLSHPTAVSRNKSGGSTRETLENDFLIVGPETHGIPGLVHLLGMESPGLTSSLAVAAYVASILQLGQDGK